MPTQVDVRRCALALPQAYEATHLGVPDFRVNKRIFCTLSSGEPRMVLKLNPEDQHNLLECGVVEPVVGRWGGKGWTYVYFERLPSERVFLLLRLAWANVAPKRLLKT